MDTTNNSLLTSDLSATITGLHQRTEYGIQVRAKTQRGWGAYSPAIFKTTGQVLNTGKNLVEYLNEFTKTLLSSDV